MTAHSVILLSLGRVPVFAVINNSKILSITPIQIQD